MTGLRGAYSYRDDPAVPPFDDSHAILVFDGECLVCSGWVNVVLRHDRAGRFRFLTAQSPLGEALYRHYGLETRNYETNILIEHGCAFFKSEGAIRMAAGLGYPFKLSPALRILPRRLRDALYDLVARNRYRIAGRRDRCYVPTAEHTSRFLG
ncbi:thiol-disulfide oxidoreductase DCC family protein [Pararhizobium antarcticum]|uniref:Thiol-disulfide oxidoreductase n=1 Tax=Pararhizobium antarcticum TaxID=1798805 RepID=A0A657LUB8_9HYPH|nr:DCC1-like thiol-disulfide oxidoreductase family protein [Pararhizobium antarcticum]OJF98723.1 thiol-disulfide oxidoreductase [Pararhizobium antarcticum]OJF98889.1 thiol-disulfide oxidoreductase [Pararhizobium antarcticum]OJF99144.1 thiol-disulfide oxidoreductase [Rhizobium sp. 58]